MENLVIQDMPLPPVQEGWVRIRVEAFGLNRSELMTRLGLSGEAVTFPRVLGIESAGVVDAATERSGLQQGQQVVAMMGGMGRTYDGSYAEYTLVPMSQVIPIETGLPWEVVGALPEMIQTATGSLTTGLDLQPGQTLLIRGGTSSVGLATAALARQLGATVLATTRQLGRVDMLKHRGIDHPIVDTGEIADAVRKLFPDGVDAALELVGTKTMPDTLHCVRIHGTVCFTGMLANQWTIKDFYPIDYIPAGVRLTAYEGNASDLPRDALQRVLDAVADGSLPITVHQVYDGLEQVRQAHTDMETNAATGKLVVRIQH